MFQLSIVFSSTYVRVPPFVTAAVFTVLGSPVSRLPVFVSLLLGLPPLALALPLATGALPLPVALALAVLPPLFFLLPPQAEAARASTATPAAIWSPLRLTSMSLLLATALWVVRK